MAQREYHNKNSAILLDKSPSYLNIINELEDKSSIKFISVKLKFSMESGLAHQNTIQTFN